jgi:hypothetical protein
MALDVSALSNYTKEQETALVLKSAFDGKTASMVQAGGTVLTGVKSAEKIPLMDTDVVFQAGGSCGFSSSGTTTFTDRTLTIGKVKVNESLCPKSLEAKAIQKKMKKGSATDNFPFEQEYSELKAARTAEALETADWQGDTTSGTANLSKYDGYLKLIDAAAGSIVATNVKSGTGTITATTGAATVAGVGTAFTSEVAVGDKIYNTSGVLVGTVLSIASATALTLAANGAVAVTAGSFIIAPAAGYHFASLVTSITTANVVGVVDNIWMSFPAAVKGKEDVRIFCGWDVYEKYIKALISANLYHYDADRTSGEINIPGTSYKLVAVNGLNSTDRVIGIRLSNMFLGVDLENEEEKFEIFYAKEADEIRYVNEFKRGVQVALPAEIVSFKKLPA